MHVPIRVTLNTQEYDFGAQRNVRFYAGGNGYALCYLSQIFTTFTNVAQGGPKIGTFLYTSTSSNINRFSKFYLLILLSVPTDVFTDVIGIWSGFFESFVCL